MSDFQHIIQPGLGGLNYDDDVKSMPPNDSAYRQNIVHVNPTGSQDVENIMGTSKVSYLTSPISRYETVPGGSTCTITIASNIGSYSVIDLVFETSMDVYTNQFSVAGLSQSTVITNIVNYITGVWISDSDLTAPPTSGSDYVEVSFAPAAVQFLATKTLSGTNPNDIIGWCGYEELRSIIYFVYSPSGYHLILRYGIEDETVYPILIEEVFGAKILAFNSAYRIINPKVIGSNENSYLSFTDGLNEPRIFNITKMENALNNLIDATSVAPTYNGSNYSTGMITVIKNKPKPITAAYARDESFDYNNLRGLIFQFSCRHIYPDGERTVWSDFSEAVYPQQEEIVSFKYVNDLYENNELVLVVPTESLASYTEIAYRRVDVGSGAASDLFYYDNISASTSSYSFKNDKVSIPLDQSDTDRPYDYVPRIAGAHETVADNRIVYGKITEGFDNITIDVDLADVTAAYGYLPLYQDSDNIAGFGGTGTWVIPVIIGLPGGEYKINISSPVTAITVSIPGETSKGDAADAVVAALNGAAIANITAANVADNVVVTNDTAAGITATLTFKLTTLKIKNFLDISTNKFGIIYMDAYGRQSFVQDAGSITIPNRYTYIGTYTDNNFAIGVKWTINHLPPSWATKYKWVYGGHNVLKYVDTPIEDDPSLIAATTPFLKINLTALSTAYANVSFFTPQAGDYIRFVGEYAQSSWTPAFSYNTVALQDEPHIYQISNYDGTYIYVSELSAAQFDDIFASAVPVLMSIFRLKKEDSSDSSLFFDIGETYDITGGFHQKGLSGFGVTSQNQTGGQAATGVFAFGNSILDYKAADIPTTSASPNRSGYIQSLSVSELYPSEITNYGRVSITSIDVSERLYPTKLRWGGVLSDESNINNVNTFLELDQKFLNEKYGGINMLIQNGQTLKAYQNNKVVSLYMGRQQALDASGNQQLSYTDNVIGSPNEYIEQYGTEHPFSVVKNDRNIYFFDLDAGTFVRDAPNGLEPIGDIKMQRYFQEKSVELKELGDGHYDILSGYDDVNEMLFVTFIDKDTAANSETIGFHEPTNRWFSFYSFIPDMYASLGEISFFTFKDGDLWIFNDPDANRCNFYATANSSIVDINVNNNANAVKIFDTIEISPDDNWSPSSNGDIAIPATVKYPNGMSSKLPSGKFSNQEGIRRTEFLRDMLTNGSTPQLLDLTQGRLLRGQTMNIRLRNSDTDRAVLNMVTVKSTISK